MIRVTTLTMYTVIATITLSSLLALPVIARDYHGEPVVIIIEQPSPEPSVPEVFLNKPNTVTKIGIVL